MQILPFLLPCLRGAVRTARDGSAVPSSPERSSWRSRASFLESWWAALLLQTRAFPCCSPSVLGAAEFLCSYVMDCRWLCLENLLFFSQLEGIRSPVLPLLGHCSQSCWPWGQRCQAEGLQKGAPGQLLPFAPSISRSHFFPS